MNYGNNVGGPGGMQQQPYMGQPTGPPQQMMMGRGPGQMQMSLGAGQPPPQQMQMGAAMPPQQGMPPQGNRMMMQQRNVNMPVQPPMQMGHPMGPTSMGHQMGQPPMTSAGPEMYGNPAAMMPAQLPPGPTMMPRGGMPVTQAPAHSMPQQPMPINQRPAYGTPQQMQMADRQAAQFYISRFNPQMKQAFENEKDPHKKSRIYHSCVDQLHQNGIVYQGQFMGGQGNMPLGANEMDRSMVSNVPYQMSRIPPGQMPPNHQMGGPAPPPTTNPAMMAAYAQQTAPFTPAKVAISAQLQAQQAQAIPSTGPGSVGSMSQVAPSMMPNMSMPSQMPPGQNMQNAAYGMRPGMPQSIPSSVPPASMNQMLSVPSPAPQIGSVGSHPSAMAHSPAVASVGPASQSQQPQSQQPHTPQNPASVQQPASVPAPNSTGQPGSVSAPNSVADPETTAIIAKVSELYSDKLNKIVQRCKDDEETVPVAILRLMEILEGKRIYAQISRLENLAKEALDKFGLSASIGNTMKDVIRKKEKRESDVAPPELTVNNAPIPSAQPVKVDVWNRRIKTKGICIPDAVLSLFDDGSTAEKTILSESFDSSGRLLVVPLNSSGAGQVDASTPSRKRKASPEPEINDKRQRTDSGNTTNPTVHFVDTPKRLMKSEGNEAAAPSGNAQPAAADPNSPATSSGASTERIKIECSADTRTPWMMSAVASQELEGLSWRVDPDRRPMSSLSPDVVLCFESKSIACPPLRLLIPASYPLEPAIVQYDRTFPPNIAISRQLAALFEQHLNMSDSRSSITTICDAYYTACEELQRLRTLGQFDSAARRQKQLVA